MKILSILCLLGLSVPLAAQSRYSNARYGVSLQYPKEYNLIEGDLPKNDTGLGYLGVIRMEFAAPGGVRVVTIEAPRGSYPGTDFVNSFFTVNVNQYLTRAECEEFPEDLAGLEGPERLTKTLGGIEFHGVNQGEGGAGHQYGGTYYHGFSDGLCYELGYGLATAGLGAVDGMKPVSQKDVFAILEGILKSVTVTPPEPPVRPANAASIRSFTVTPLDKWSPPHTFRLSWEVEQAEAGQVWLSALNCGGDFTLWRLSNTGLEAAEFPCGALVPAGTAKGSLGLEFRNMTGQEIKETVRLFAAGREAVSMTQTLSLPSLPAIITIQTDGNLYSVHEEEPPGQYTQIKAGGSYITFGNRSRLYVEIVEGHTADIEGVGFLPAETLRIGSTSLPITSADRGKITFAVPQSLPAGFYLVWLENVHGKSNVVRVQIRK